MKRNQTPPNYTPPAYTPPAGAQQPQGWQSATSHSQQSSGWYSPQPQQQAQNQAPERESFGSWFWRKVREHIVRSAKRNLQNLISPPQKQQPQPKRRSWF